MHQSNPTALLAVYLLSEIHSGKSFFQPYIEALPESFDSPLFWSADELKQLHPSPVFGMSHNYTTPILILLLMTLSLSLCVCVCMCVYLHQR
jgi:hypothetical protein